MDRMEIDGGEDEARMGLEGQGSRRYLSHHTFFPFSILFFLKFNVLKFGKLETWFLISHDGTDEGGGNGLQWTLIVGEREMRAWMKCELRMKWDMKV